MHLIGAKALMKYGAGLLFERKQEIKSSKMDGDRLWAIFKKRKGKESSECFQLIHKYASESDINKKVTSEFIKETAKEVWPLARAHSLVDSCDKDDESLCIEMDLVEKPLSADKGIAVSVVEEDKSAVDDGKSNVPSNRAELRDNLKHLHKVVVLGDIFCGKTSLLVRFIRNQFHSDAANTIGGTRGS
jgi:hypothetical protein